MYLLYHSNPGLLSTPVAVVKSWKKDRTGGAARVLVWLCRRVTPGKSLNFQQLWKIEGAYMDLNGPSCGCVLWLLPSSHTGGGGVRGRGGSWADSLTLEGNEG